MNNSDVRAPMSVLAMSCGFVFTFAAAAAMAADATGAAVPRPVLAELFTSESCSSCPPADALLRQISGRDDVLPLSFHVDYWDGLGWTDRFASPQFTARQQNYASSHHWGVYTPQLVVDGRADVVGSDRSAVLANLSTARASAMGAAINIAHTLGELDVSIGQIAGADQPRTADVYLISFDAAAQTQVRGGENSGASLSHANVVRSMRKIGDWTNRREDLKVSLGPTEIGDRFAVLIQDSSGTVWGLGSVHAL